MIHLHRATIQMRGLISAETMLSMPLPDIFLLVPGFRQSARQRFISIMAKRRQMNERWWIIFAFLSLAFFAGYFCRMIRITNHRQEAITVVIVNGPETQNMHIRSGRFDSRFFVCGSLICAEYFQFAHHVFNFALEQHNVVASPPVSIIFRSNAMRPLSASFGSAHICTFHTLATLECRLSS